MPKRVPPLAHPEHDKTIYAIRFRDEDGRNFELSFKLDVTEAVALVNAMMLAGVTERKLPRSPFTAVVRVMSGGEIR